MTSFAKKLFQQIAFGRREKKIWWDKAKEEVKSLITPDNPDPQPNIDKNAIDLIFLTDFAQTEEDLKILNSQGYSINMVLTIKEQPVIFNYEDNGDPIYEDIAPEMRIPDEVRANEIWKYQIVFDNYRSSSKTSIARNVLFINYDYLHEIHDGKGEEPPRNSIVDTAKAIYETV